MVRKKRRCRKDGLTSRVMKFRANIDDEGPFISYCTYSFHRGLVQKPDVCETRRCRHYNKFYLDPGNLRVYHRKDEK